MGEGPYRPGSKTSDLGRYRKETKGLVRQRAQVAHVLDNGDVFAQQRRMHGPLGVAGVIDVERMDPDERGSQPHEVLARVEREKRMSRQVVWGSPMSIPAGVDQHGLTCQIEAVKRWCRDSSAGLRRNANYDPCQIRQGFEREL